MSNEDVTQLPQSADAPKKKLVAKLAEKYGVDGDKLLGTLKATCFKTQNHQVTNEEMMALLVVADQYRLNPFTKEIFAFPDKQNGIVPVVGVDGWSRIINDHKTLDGIEFRYSEEFTTPEGGQSCPDWCEVIIHRKDREHPTVVREYLDEVYRKPFKAGMKGPWQTHTKRFLRHKALIQGARIAFGFSGIYDEDEAQNIIDITPAQTDAPPRPQQEDFEHRPTEAVEMFKLVDEFGDTVGEFSAPDFITECEKRIEAIAQAAGGLDRLEAFMDINERFEAFEPRSEERQAIASAYNAARDILNESDTIDEDAAKQEEADGEDAT